MTNVIQPKCKACNLPIDDRKALDVSLLRGEPITTLSQRFNLSRDVLYRHKNNHLGGAAALGVRRSAENHGVRLLEDLDDLIVTTRRILREAEEDGHRKTALAAVKEVRSSIMSIATISHAIWQQQNQEQQTVIVQQQDEQQKQWISEGLANLTHEERVEYRRLCIKMLEGWGSNNSNEEKESSNAPDLAE